MENETMERESALPELFIPEEGTELSEKGKLAKALRGISEIDFTEIPADTKRQMLELLRENILPIQRSFANYRCAIMEIETKFRVLNEEFSLVYDGNPIESIKSRVKGTDSIIRKIIRKKIPLEINALEENLEDIAGVRVICSFIDDIYKLADCLLGQDDIVLIKIKDYIKNPKPSGYRSLHLIVAVPIFLENEKKMVKVEVQLRTIAMDFWASLEHKMRYNKNLEPEVAEELSKELSECAKESADLDYRMQAVKNKFLRGGKADLK